MSAFGSASLPEEISLQTLENADGDTLNSLATTSTQVAKLARGIRNRREKRVLTVLQNFDDLLFEVKDLLDRVRAMARVSSDSGDSAFLQAREDTEVQISRLRRLADLLVGVFPSNHNRQHFVVLSISLNNMADELRNWALGLQVPAAVLNIPSAIQDWRRNGQFITPMEARRASTQYREYVSRVRELAFQHQRAMTVNPNFAFWMNPANFGDGHPRQILEMLDRCVRDMGVATLSLIDRDTIRVRQTMVPFPADNALLIVRQHLTAAVAEAQRQADRNA